MSPGPISDSYEGSDAVDLPDEYPPLTPVEVYPLHGWDYESRGYSCKGGERAQFDWRCPDCVTFAEEVAQDFPDLTVRWKQSADHDERPVPLTWLIARSRALGVQ